MALEIRTAAELTDPELEARWTTRRAARETDVLQQVLRAFVEGPGPVAVEQIVAAFADGPSEGIRQDLARLDEDDLIQIRDGLVDVAYPFSAFPTPFVVQLADGQARYSCCAIDAVGIAPMLGQRVSLPPLRGASGTLGRPGWLGAGRRGRHGLGRQARGRRAARLDLALNDAQLLPVGRAPAGVARGRSRRRRGGDAGVRGLQARCASLWRAPEEGEAMTSRHITVYWSTT
jgi:Alkylmercury lyase